MDLKWTRSKPNIFQKEFWLKIGIENCWFSRQSYAKIIQKPFHNRKSLKNAFKNSWPECPLFQIPFWWLKPLFILHKISCHIGGSHSSSSSLWLRISLRIRSTRSFKFACVKSAKLKMSQKRLMKSSKIGPKAQNCLK